MLEAASLHHCIVVGTDTVPSCLTRLPNSALFRPWFAGVQGRLVVTRFEKLWGSPPLLLVLGAASSDMSTRDQRHSINRRPLSVGTEYRLHTALLLGTVSKDHIVTPYCRLQPGKSLEKPGLGYTV